MAHHRLCCRPAVKLRHFIHKGPTGKARRALPVGALCPGGVQVLRKRLRGTLNPGRLGNLNLRNLGNLTNLGGLESLARRQNGVKGNIRQNSSIGGMKTPPFCAYTMQVYCRRSFPAGDWPLRPFFFCYSVLKQGAGQ